MKRIPGKWILMYCVLIYYSPGLLAQGVQVSKDSTLVKSSKLSPSLRQKPALFFSDSVTVTDFLLQARDLGILLGYARKLKIEISSIRVLGKDLVRLRTCPVNITRLLREVNAVVFVDEMIKPAEEGGVSSFDHSINRINAAHHYFPGINGEGQTVSVKEYFMDTTDIDLLGRYKPSSARSSTGSTHSTIMTTLISGAGNSYYKGKGVAFKSRYTSSAFDTALPDTATYYEGLKVGVQNHSYGTGIQNYYGINARAFDLSVNQSPHLIHVFSAGNAGNSSSSTGPYSGMNGFANITGNLKMAKNALVVGAIDSLGNIPIQSSRGPAYDGRIKPDFMAFAEDGTSGSAALVSGALLLLQQLYSQSHSQPAGADLLRAILMNSADDIGPVGPDYSSGFGSMNLYKSLQTLQANHYFSESLEDGVEKDFEIAVAPNTKLLKITLAWSDTAAEAGASKALINDLDLQLRHPASTQVWQPWVLNAAADPDSLQQPAQRKLDTLNNVEQISLDNPSAGNYAIHIRGSKILTKSQSFAVAYQVDTSDKFIWLFPTGSDAVISNQKQFIRWQSTFADLTRGKLEFSKDGAVTWQIIDPAVLLSNQQYYFPLPDTICVAQFRMTIGSQAFPSDDFALSPPLDLKVGFACDSVLLYWNRPLDHTLFQLFRLDGDSLRPEQQTSADNLVVVPGNGEPYYAIAPIVDGRNTVKSYAVNYTMQGAGCYIKSFLADLVRVNEGEIQLELGSLYQVKKISIQKWTNGFHDVLQQTPVSQNFFVYSDRGLNQGLNRYRAIIELQNGDSLYSTVETIYYTNGKPYLVFPNPVRSGQPLQLLVEDVTTQATAQIFSSQGSLARKFTINERLVEIPTNGLGTGLFFLVVTAEGRPQRKYPFVIQ